ncbi:hypothetical protein K1719_009137 [Acacia pycnantha]|nr:hypothetical protein K1719_009137 [Acacia pycnantha]
MRSSVIAVSPGDPYPLKNDTPPAPVPAPSADNFLGRYISEKSVDQKQTDGEPSNVQITIPKVPSNQPIHQTHIQI